MAILIDKLSGKRYELGQTAIIGRGSSCSILFADPLMSRTHAEVRRRPNGSYLLVDLGSTHGTSVNGQPTTEASLQNGDEILLGSTRLTFRDAESVEVVGKEQGSEPGVEQKATEPWIQQCVRLKHDAAFAAAQEIHSDEELRRNYEKLRAAYELSSAIGMVDDLDTLLERILDTAFRLLAADRGAILLLDPETGRPVPRVAKRRGQQREKIVLSKSILHEVMAQKAGLILSDAISDARFDSSESIEAMGIRSAMCVPLMHGGELLGIMHVDSLAAANVFQERDLELFATIANQAALAVKNALLHQRIQEEAKARAQFQRFLSPSLVDQVIGGKLHLEQAGEQRTVAILFADIRGFTRISEGLAPTEVVQFLNEYFESMVDVLFANGGTFDKYVGDELMAIFGFPVAIANPSHHAVRCALEMLKELRGLNERRKVAGQEPILVGIGIHTGEAVCGAIGSSKALQYTAIGDAVNTASRLCQLAEGDQIVISEQTLRAIEASFEAEELPSTTIKGKKEPLRLYQVLGLSPETK